MPVTTWVKPAPLRKPSFSAPLTVAARASTAGAGTRVRWCPPAPPTRACTQRRQHTLVSPIRAADRQANQGIHTTVRCGPGWPCDVPRCLDGRIVRPGQNKNAQTHEAQTHDMQIAWPAAGADGCPIIGGYTVEADVDRFGDDIGLAGSVAQALDACTSDRLCIGFNSGGWYKTSVAPTTRPSNMCLYTKMPSAPTPDAPSESGECPWRLRSGRACVCACIHACCVCACGLPGPLQVWPRTIYIHFRSFRDLHRVCAHSHACKLVD